MRQKHTWHSIPERWERHNHPPSTIVWPPTCALRSSRITRIPWSKHFTGSVTEVQGRSPSSLILCVAIHIRIWCHADTARLIYKLSCHARRVASGRSQTHQPLARPLLRDSPFFGLNITWRLLAIHLQSSPGPGKHRSGRIIPGLSTHQDGPDHSLHDLLRASHCHTRVCRDCRPDNVLRFATHSFANLASGSERCDASEHNNADRLTPVV